MMMGVHRWPTRSGHLCVCQTRTVPSVRIPVVVPTIESMRRVLPSYGARFDLTLAAARKEVGDQPDLINPAHADRIRKVAK